MSVIITSSPPLTSFVRHPDLFNVRDQYKTPLQSTCQRTPNSSTTTIPTLRGDCAPISSIGMYHWRTDATNTNSLSEVAMNFGKSVRFADAIGLPLTQVKILYVEDEIEDNVSSSPSDPFYHISSYSSPPIGSIPSTITKPGLFLNFPQPRTRLDLLGLVKVNHVTLENVVITDNDVMATILVHNLSFVKTVILRVSKDYWISYNDLECKYDLSMGKDIDRFIVKFTVEQSFPIGARIEMCVQYKVGGDEFWDNNNGVNYQIECKAVEKVQSKGLAERNELCGVAFPPYLNLKPPPDMADIRALFMSPYY